jgi:DNA-binding MarR family transcriptional regulator
VFPCPESENDVAGRGAERAGLLELAEQMSDAVRRLALVWDRAPLSVNPRLSAQQLVTLESVSASPGINLTGLADVVGVGHSAASRLCDRLEAAGLLERRIPPENRREIHLTATSRGRSLLDEVAARRRQDLAAILAEIPPDRRGELRDGLRAVSALDRGRAGRQDPPG